MNAVKKYSTIIFFVLLIQSLIAATGAVDYNGTRQQLDGFGGAAVYDVTNLIVHPDREEIYDLLFAELGVDILRIRNTYDYKDDNGASLSATGTIVAEAREPQRNPNLKLELVPWSPAYYVKSNNDESGGGTLAGGPSDYVYDDYAQWWADSLTDTTAGWPSVGVYPDFISIQNEPDIETDYDSCYFAPTQTTSYAGYDQAFEAVYNELYSRMGSSTPQMWAPCTMGFGNSQAYINALVNRGQINNIAGFSHHLYSDGSYDNPDGMITGMQNYKTDYGDYYNKPLHMTEYVKLSTTPNFDMGLKFAWHIYNCLYYEGVTSFFNWTLFRGPSAEGGGIVTMTSSSDYVIRPQYWFLKGYSHFTDPDWYVLDALVDGTGASNLRMAAFKSPDNTRLTIVITNISTSSTSLMLSLNDFIPVISEVYRSSATENWAYQGTYSPSLTLPGESITTIALTASTGPMQTLSASSNEGGSVTIPGEGDFQYPQDYNAVITATPDWHYHFDYWSGSAVTAGKVAAPYSASTTVLMDANYAVVANFEADPPSSDVELITQWQTGLTNEKPNGTNRALVFIAHAEEDGSIALNSVTYGGQAMEKIIEQVVGSSYQAYVVAYMLDEDGIAAATSNTFEPVWNVTSPDNTGYSSVFLGNVNQSEPLGESDSNNNATATPATITTDPLSTAQGDMVFVAATCGNVSNYTADNGFTKAVELDMSSSTGVSGYKFATGANETPSVTNSNLNRQVIIGFVIQSVVTCQDILNAGLGLVSDLDENCYVDFNDLQILTDFWLVTNCGELNDCDGADFPTMDGDVDFEDFSDFSIDWMNCNNPQDANCAHNM
ncbi:MAG: hypothetical protein WC374_06440 [Phycisphaerae bacterium]|jgi:O-glycosyl hydrolase